MGNYLSKRHKTFKTKAPLLAPLAMSTILTAIVRKYGLTVLNGISVSQTVF